MAYLYGFEKFIKKFLVKFVLADLVITVRQYYVNFYITFEFPPSDSKYLFRPVKYASRWNFTF